jgi:hypothetical protein
VTFDLTLFVKNTINFDMSQVITLDGFFARNSRLVNQPAFANSIQTFRNRENRQEALGEVSLMLSGRTNVVERVYPNVIEFSSTCGGIIEVIFVSCSVIVFFHHYIIMDQHIINKAILSSNGDKTDASKSDLLKRSRTVRNELDMHTH